MGNVNITYYGHSMFLVEDSRINLIIDPFGENVGYKLPELEAKLVLISHDHFDHNNAAMVKGVRHVLNKIEPFPFLMGSVRIVSLSSYHDDRQGNDRGENIIFKWKMSGLTFVHMGDYGEAGLSMEQAECISEADVLMIPVGGVYTINCQKAQEIVEALNPSIAIPMHYKTNCCMVDINDAEEFVSSFENPVFHTSTVTISSNKLPEKTEVWVLKPVH